MIGASPVSSVGPRGPGKPTLSRRQPRRDQGLRLAAVVAAASGAMVAMAIGAAVDRVDRLLPDARLISSYVRPGGITILAADGQVIQKLGPVTREKVAQGAMPTLVKQAFIAAEDRRFLHHEGIDPIGIVRALQVNLRSGSVLQGASTITQQLARMVFLNQDRTLLRKLREALLALKLERQLSKQQILDQYLNNVYLGAGAHGIADAAWVYFSRSVDGLTLAQAALIAALAPAPSVYSPLVNPELALRQRNRVLHDMEEAGFLTPRQRMVAVAEPLALQPAEPKHLASAAPYFSDYVIRRLPQVVGEEWIERGGLIVLTSLDLSWQDHAETIIREHRPSDDIQGALVTLEPGTGYVRALVGGTDFRDSQFNRAIQAHRSPGSTFKLFVYLAGLQVGMGPDTLFRDARVCFGTYCPRNFGNRYAGTITMADALRRSLNTVAVQIAAHVGIDKVLDVARDLGVTSGLEPYFPVALGASGQTVLEMTGAYAAVANGGVYMPPTPFLRINSVDGQLLWSHERDGEQGRRVLDRDIAETMNQMLKGVVSDGTGQAAQLPGREVVGKSGTSEGAKDLWFVGSIPQLTTGMWFGYDDNRPTRMNSGVTSEAWRDYMEPITGDLMVRTFPRPSSKVKVVQRLPTLPAQVGVSAHATHGHGVQADQPAGDPAATLDQPPAGLDDRVGTPFIQPAIPDLGAMPSRFRGFPMPEEMDGFSDNPQAITPSAPTEPGGAAAEPVLAGPDRPDPDQPSADPDDLASE